MEALCILYAHGLLRVKQDKACMISNIYIAHGLLRVKQDKACMISNMQAQ